MISNHVNNALIDLTKFNAIELSQQLIRIPSYSGVNLEVIKLLQDILQPLNFSCQTQNYSGDNSYEVNNLHAIYQVEKNLPTLYFAGHSDVVKEGDKNAWQFPPFAGEIADQKLYGRGASDMKCAIACFVSAVAEFLKDNPKPKFAIGFLITNDEESDGVNGTNKVLQWMKQNNLPIDYCLVGEPTNPSKFGEMIKIGRRGSVGFKLTIEGKQGHVAYPHNALNPITILINVLKILKDHKLDNGNEFFDPSNLEITSINSPNLGGNVITSLAEANFNIRFNDIHNSKSIVEWVEYVCSKSIGSIANYQLTNRVSGEAFLSQPKKLANLVSQAVYEICKIEPVLSTTGGTSDARFIKNYAQEVIEIGLVNETAHKIDEYSKLSEIEQLQKVYLKILNLFNQ
jgi:succinyl-diaminopimelate desuccinylase